MTELPRRAITRTARLAALPMGYAGRTALGLGKRLGGQSAEELFFDDISTGPAGDLSYATNVAAQMVGQAGMSDTLISFSAVQSSAFGDQGLVGRVLADGDGRQMVEALLRSQKERARSLLEDNQHLVVALRDALLERHELIGREITDVLEQADAERSPHAPGDGATLTVDLRRPQSWWSPAQREKPSPNA